MIGFGMGIKGLVYKNEIPHAFDARGFSGVPFEMEGRVMYICDQSIGFVPRLPAPPVVKGLQPVRLTGSEVRFKGDAEGEFDIRLGNIRIIARYTQTKFEAPDNSVVG